MSANGSSQTNLSSQDEPGRGDVRDGDVACSRDGQQLAFFRSTSQSDFKTVTVWTMHADGSDQTELRPTMIREPLLGPEFMPWGSSLIEIEWSPDGTVIFLGDARKGPIGFRLGDSRYQLLGEEGFIGGWSPDGTKAVLGGGDILVEDEDGTTDRLTEDAARDFAPDWSPDGSRIAFESAGRDGRFDADIYLIDPDGSGLTRLTTDAGQDTAPAWSPDGSTIAFESDRDGDREVFLMNADGSSQTQLTQNAADDGHPCWLP